MSLPSITELDNDIKFLTEEEARLRRPPLDKERWAQSRADRYKKLIETFTRLRRHVSMTTIGGKQLEG